MIKKNSDLVDRQNLSIQEISSSHLDVEYSGNNKIISTTIPYDEGWTIYDNGEKVKTEQNWNNFVAFQLSDSKEHHIELIYRPIGYLTGLKITIGSFILLFVYELFEFRKRDYCRFKRKQEGDYGKEAS